MNDDDVFYRISMIMNVDQAEIAKIVHDYIERGIVNDCDRLNCPKPPIYIGPVVIKTLRDRIIEESAKELQNEVDKQILQKEEKEMKATSVQVINNVKDMSVTIEKSVLEGTRIIISVSTDDDTYEINCSGDGCEKFLRKNDFVHMKEYEYVQNQLMEREKEIRELKQQLQEAGRDKKNLRDKYEFLDRCYKGLLKDNKNLIKYKESLKSDLDLERAAVRELEKDNKNLTEAYNSMHESVGRALREKQQLKEEYEDKIEDLQYKYNLEKAANEAQHKFFREYAGKGTEIEFNYAIGDDGYTYVIVDKEEYKALKNIQNNVKDNGCYVAMIHGKFYNPAQLVDRVLELEALKTPTIENFADEEPSDNVNHPSHYTGRYECIDVMQDVFGNEATDNFCLCNAFKYIWRARKKNGLEDVKKAVWYLKKYIEEAENGVRKGEQV